MMYDPKTGKGIMAKKFADHEKLKKQGYTHDDPSTKQIEENKGVAEKAKKSGIPKGILMQVFRRGMAAYGTGHRPGGVRMEYGCSLSSRRKDARLSTPRFDLAHQVQRKWLLQQPIEDRKCSRLLALRGRRPSRALRDVR